VPTVPGDARLFSLCVGAERERERERERTKISTVALDTLLSHEFERFIVSFSMWKKGES
jgi:hypothetical protein